MRTALTGSESGHRAAPQPFRTEIRSTGDSSQVQRDRMLERDLALLGHFTLSFKVASLQAVAL